MSTLFIVGLFLGVCLLVLALSNLMAPKNAPPPQLYDAYGQPVPLGRSPYFDISYRPHEQARHSLITISIGMLMAFGILFIHANKEESGSMENTSYEQLRTGYAPQQDHNPFQ